MKNWTLILVILAVFCVFNASSSYFRIFQADDEEFADNFLARGGGGGGSGGSRGGSSGGSRSGGMSGGFRGSSMSGGISRTGGSVSGGRPSVSVNGGRTTMTLNTGKPLLSASRPSGSPVTKPSGGSVGKPSQPSQSTGKPASPVGKPATPVKSATPSSVSVSGGINNGVPSANVQAKTQVKNTQLSAKGTVSPSGGNLQLQSTTKTPVGKFGLMGNIGTDGGASIGGSASLNVGPGKLNLGASASNQGPASGSVGYSYKNGVTTVNGQVSADLNGGGGAQVGVSRSIGKNGEIGAYGRTDFNGHVSGGIEFGYRF